jgi:signal transduction histidine kinase
MARSPILHSIRFRMAVLYTLVVFAVGALVVGAINLALSSRLSGDAVAADLQIRRISAEPGAALFLDAESLEIFEELANQRAVEQLHEMSLITLGVLFPFSLVAGWFIAGRVLRPVDEIAGVAREIQASDLSRRIHLDGPDDELKHLADTFDEMLDRIEQGAEDQRRFIQDISHELRNPLATMATSLDVALSDPNADAGALRDAAQVLRRSLDRTTRTVDGLMRFARRDLATESATTVDLGLLAREVADELRAPAARRGIAIDHVGQSGPSVTADRLALRSAIANLAGNAVRLAPLGSTVVCGAGVQDDWAWVGVRDEGPGIVEHDHRHVFQRNWGKDHTRMRDEERAGLGLSIVRQVAEASGGTVTLTSTPAVGSSFVVWLPLHGAANASALTLDGIHPVRDPLAVF